MKTSIKPLRVLNVLVECEESQVVMKAFRKLGHNAKSCDIKECSGGEPEHHLQIDIFEALDLQKWDIVILHPPCTALALSGNRWYGYGKEKYNGLRLGVFEMTFLMIFFFASVFSGIITLSFL